MCPADRQTDRLQHTERHPDARYICSKRPRLRSTCMRRGPIKSRLVHVHSRAHWSSSYSSEVPVVSSTMSHSWCLMQCSRRMKSSPTWSDARSNICGHVGGPKPATYTLSCDCSDAVDHRFVDNTKCTSSTEFLFTRRLFQRNRIAFSALTMLVKRQKEYPACKN